MAKEELEPEATSEENSFVEEVEAEATPATVPQKKSMGMIDQILWIAGIALVAVLMAGWLGNTVRGKADDIASQVQEENGSSTVDQSPPDEVAPQIQRQPTVDLAWAWPILGVAGGGAGIVLLSALSFGAIRRSRRLSLEDRIAQEARAEDKRKALNVWQKYIDTHGRLKDKVLEIETDWDLLFSYPTLVDSSVPQTREFHRALRAADTASSEPPAELNLSMAIG